MAQPVSKFGGVPVPDDQPYVSKFGGVPVPDDQPYVSKFGGVPVPDDQPSSSKFGGVAIAEPKTPPFSDPSMNASMDAGPKTGFGGKVAQWAGNAADDLRYGGDTTIVGKAAKALGVNPVRNQVSPQTSEYMASLPLGGLRAVKGLGEIAEPGERMQGAKDVGAGVMQASEIPLSFMAPEGVAAGAAKAKGLLPSAERAGQTFNEVKNAVGARPINLEAPGNAALESLELSRRGNPAPAKPIQDFLRRTTAPDRVTRTGAEIEHPPLTFAEGRDFYSAAAAKQATDEATRLNRQQLRALGGFKTSLGQSLQDVANEGGVGDKYSQALQEYRKAMQIQNALQVGKKAAIGAAGAGATYELGKKIIGRK